MLQYHRYNKNYNGETAKSTYSFLIPSIGMIFENYEVDILTVAIILQNDYRVMMEEF